jgi:hypothetical protein
MRKSWIVVFLGVLLVSCSKSVPQTQVGEQPTMGKQVSVAPQAQEKMHLPPSPSSPPETTALHTQWVGYVLVDPFYLQSGTTSVGLFKVPQADSSSGVPYVNKNLELGFRSDGVVVWRLEK